MHNDKKTKSMNIGTKDPNATIAEIPPIKLEPLISRKHSVAS